MAGTTGWDPDQIEAMGRTVADEGLRLAGLGPIAPPSTTAFGKLLQPPATNAFPFTTDGIGTFLDRSADAVAQMGEGLAHSARSYQAAEDQAVMFAHRITGTDGGAVGADPAPEPVAVTPMSHWASARQVLGAGEASGGDSFAGTNSLRVLAPTGLDWLNAPVAVYELVANGLGFLAGTLLSYFPPFDEAIETLTGDPDSIRAFKATLESLATSLDAHVDGMDAATRTTPDWFGDAADAYLNYATVQSACMRSAEALVEVIGPSVEGVAANTGEARRMVIAVLVNVIEEILRAALPNLFWLKVALGLAVVPGGIFVSAAMISGILTRFLAWVAEFLATEMQVIAEVMRDVAQQGAGYLGQIRQLGHSMQRAGETLRTGTDPGPGYGVDDGSVAESMFGTQPDPRDGSIIDLMAGDLPDGYEEVTAASDLEALGLVPDMLVDDANGFRARVYRDADGNYVVMFDGTDFTDPQQRDLLQENIPGGTGMGPQSEMAMAIAQAIGASPEQNRVIYGGHSLGGRLASIAAMTSGNPAVTANAAGVSPAQLEYIAQANGVSVAQIQQDLADGLVRAYRTDDDILTGLQERYPITPGLMPGAVGSPIDLPGDQNPIDGHMAGNVQDQYNSVHGTKREGSLTPGG